MPRLPSSNQILKILERGGFVFVSQKGSHAKFRKLGAEKRTVILPMNRKEIPIGTLKSIVRQSGLSEKNFIKYE